MKCRLGFHDFRWPPHQGHGWDIWTDYFVECARGCGARKVMRCYASSHWSEKHPEPRTETAGEAG